MFLCTCKIVTKATGYRRMRLRNFANICEGKFCLILRILCAPADSSQMMKRLQEIEQKLCSMAEESLHSSDNLTDIQQELYVLLTSLNPMSDGISQALRFIRNLGRKLPQFKNASTAISTSVLEYMEQNHGVRVNIMNPLFDI